LLCLIDNKNFGYAQTPSAFATMCKTVAQRYGPAGTNQCSTYELFNESNLSLNPPGTADPANFTQYLKRGYDAIKSVHTSSTVIAGGTTPAPDNWIPAIVNPLKWYQGIYAAGGRNYMDGLGFHLYTDTAPTPSMPQWKYMTDIRDLMVANGDTAKKVWVTEVGVGYPWPGVTSLVQARDWLKIMVEGIQSYSWTAPFYIYNWRNCTTNTSDPNSVFGMVYTNFTPKSPLYEYALTIAGTPTDPGDIVPPDPPTGVTVSEVGVVTAAVAWLPATDDFGVTAYRVYNADTDAQLAETVGSAVTLSLAPASTYRVYVTAIDAAGNESAHSTVSAPFTTDAPTGSLAAFAYTFTGSEVPTVFTQLGLGFTVTGGVALPNSSTSDGEFWTVAPYILDQQSVDHAAEISQSATSAYADRAALTVVRAKADGTEWVAAAIVDAGKVDGCQILTSIAGVVRLRAAVNTTPLLVGEKLRLAAEGNTYTAYRVTVAGGLDELVEWVDVSAIFPGVSNRRTGIGWRHKRVGAVNYPPNGISGTWKAIDINPVNPAGGGGFDAWMLGATDDDDWDQLIATGLWETALT
jgi:hypothetical protein